MEGLKNEDIPLHRKIKSFLSTVKLRVMTLAILKENKQPTKAQKN